MLVRIRIKQSEFPYKLHFFSNFRAATRGHFYVFSEFLHVIYRVLYEEANHQSVVVTFSGPAPRPQPQRRYYKNSVERKWVKKSQAHLRKIMISDGSNDIKQLVCDDTTICQKNDRLYWKS